MAWVAPMLLGGTAMYGYTSGKLAEWAGFDKNNKESSSSQQQHQSLPPQQQIQPPQVIVYESPNARSSRNWLFVSGGTALLALAGYFYYIHRGGTKKVINKVEKTAEQTQDLVQKSDKNNAKRFEELDKRNTDRSHTLEAEIRGETRAGFNMISDQLYCLTQVCIQTLSALANGNDVSGNEAGNNQKEFGRSDVNDKLLQYSERAQQMADTIISQETLLNKKQQHLQDIRAEIFQRQPVIVQAGQHVTPGGPDDTPMGPDMNNNNNNNIFDLEANQTPYLTNIKSYKDSKYISEQEMNNNNNNNKKNNKKNNGLIDYIFNNEYISKLIPTPINQYIQLKQIGNEIKENQHLIIFGGLGTILLYGGYKYIGNNNNNPRMIHNYSNYQNNNNNGNNNGIRY